MTVNPRIGVVTGANKGIGLAIVRQLALEYPRSAINKGPLLIYLTARDEERGHSAVESIHADRDLKNAHALRRDGGLTDVEFLPLDIDSNASIEKFAGQLTQRHPHGIDFVINNAGIAMQGFDDNVVTKTLHCNYFGTLEVTTKLLPQIKDGGRLVNVASVSGRLGGKYSSSVRERFLAATTAEEITALMREFTSAVAQGTHEKDWPGTAYAVSKAGVIGMTRTIALRNAQSGSKILVNACCPGYVKTDMTKGGGIKTPDQGAQTPVLLALGDVKGINGEFWQDQRPIEWRSL